MPQDPSCDEKIADIRKETEASCASVARNRFKGSVSSQVLMKIQGHPNICACLGCFDAYRPGTSQVDHPRNGWSFLVGLVW